MDPSHSNRGQAEPGQRQSVTLREPEAGGYFPCPTCKRLLPVGGTRKGKPYVQCNECGVQLFVRGKEGIRRFRMLLGQSGMSWNVRDLSTVLDHFAFLKRQLREIRKDKPLFGKDPDAELQEKLIETSLAGIREFLRRELKEKRRELREVRTGKDE